MLARPRLLAFFTAALLLSVSGCGDNGGCGPAPEKKEETPSSGGGGNPSAHSGGGDIIISDRKGRVPDAYQRKASAYETAQSNAAVGRVTRSEVDGVKGRVEIACRVLVDSTDGQCARASNYAEIVRRCCPDGSIEHCTSTKTGVVLIGRGCVPEKR